MILEMKLFMVKKYLENIYMKFGVENCIVVSVMVLEKLG